MRKSRKSLVRDNLLLVHGPGSDPTQTIPVGSQQWYTWLEGNTSFVFEGNTGHLTARREKRRGGTYWYGYRRRGGTLYKTYLGRSHELTQARLEQASATLAGQTPLTQWTGGAKSAILMAAPKGEPNGEAAEVDLSVLPLTKVKPPPLPYNLVARPRLTALMRSPVTLVCAPSGFGKSTMLNEWRQWSDLEVAWVTLGPEDNNPVRFWSKVVAALQMVHPSLGQGWLPQLRISPTSALSKIVLNLTNDLVRVTDESGAPEAIGLVLDNYHYIQNPEIHTSLQTWLEHIPPRFRLVICSSGRPPLALGYLKAKGMVVELGADDLRFTLEEGVEFLRQCVRGPRLSYHDMQTLVKRTEGWVTGLVLAAIALGQQEDRTRFAETFTGAHPLIREFFVENVLRGQPSDVQAFLLRTSVLKHLTGSLCDAVLGKSGSAEMLAHLAGENLFLERMEGTDWYRYHELFAEALRAELEAHFAAEIPVLHKRAAEWYLAQGDSSDAIGHLLAAGSGEQAAALIEDEVLPQLAQAGTDSRLLSWLPQLPKLVLRQRTPLLAVYGRLASIAWNWGEVEALLTRVEREATAGLQGKAIAADATLAEIRRIRNLRTARTGDASAPFARAEHGGWDMLDGIVQAYRDYRRDVGQAELAASAVYEAAKESRYLYGILVAGGGCANLALSQGHLRRSEQIANEALRLAFELRGSLPEPASIALAALSNVCFMRTQLAQAHQLLVRATEVDPEPASTNGVVTMAVLRAKIESARGDNEAAFATMQTARALHARRPSPIWTDQDLAAYQALFCFRQGDLPSAERLLNEGGEIAKNPFAALVRAEILIEQGRNVAAEEIARLLLRKYPHGAYLLPMMRARVILAIALFNQRKVNEARQVMAKAARLAAPEFFNRPFLDYGNQVAPLLSLVLHTANLSAGTRSFLKGTLAMLGQVGQAGPRQEPPPADEPAALSIAASISPREQEVLRMVSAGLSNQEIAAALFVSASTVKTHLENIYQKLGVNSRTQAIAQAHALKLL